MRKLISPERFIEMMSNHQKWQMTALLYRKMLVELGVSDTELNIIWHEKKPEIMERLRIKGLG